MSAQRLDTNRGFTLVELMVVMILVAVLVAVALPRYMDAVYRGKVNACRQNIQDLNTVAQAYETKHYGDQTALEKLAGTVDANHVLILENFLDGVPVCPVNDSNYDFVAVKVNGYTIGYVVDASAHFEGGDWKHGEHL